MLLLKMMPSVGSITAVYSPENCCNGVVGFILLQAGRRLRSITLRADAHHLFTDVWTSVGIALGILLVQVTGWLALDSVIALIVAANIVWAGFRLLRETGSELLDLEPL